MEKIILVFMAFMCMFTFTACNNDGGAKPVGPVVISGDSGEVVEPVVNVDAIEEKISKMTLEDKIEQMLILDYSMVPYGKEGEKDATKLVDSVRNTIANHNFGGIILFRDNTVGTEQTLRLTSDMQVAATKENKKHNIPLFMCIDQEGGRVTRLATGTSMPGNMALGAINDYDTAKEYASIIAKEVNTLGFNVDFAPVLDVNNNPSNPIIGVRSFSSDTKRVSKMGEAFIEGIQSEGVASTLKHFPGHGDTATDSHTGLPLINKTYDDIKQCELIPFKAGIDKGADMIMTAHIVYPKIETTKYISKKTGEEITLPATLSKTILTDILRNDLGYKGIIVTDALNMGAISEHFKREDVTRYALNAGVDILLMPISLLNNDEDIDAYISMIANQVRNGEINEKNINDSVYRILTLKEKMGLLKDDVDYELKDSQIKDALSIVGSKENHDKELEISKKAITLVKGDNLLPISSDNKVLFLTSYANDKNSIEYAIELLKKDNVLNNSFKYEVADFEQKEFSALKSKVDNADFVVITADTTSKTMFNNNDSKGWQGRFIDQAINEIHKQGKKVVIVSMMLPYDAARYNEADVIVCAYGDRAIPSLPIVYNGETKTFGVNTVAAIIKLFDGKEFEATLPVDIYKVDSKYNYTNDILYKVD